MNKISSNSKKNIYDNEILRALLKDPTKSLRIIAKELKSYRQKIWRKKNKLEEDKVIWGYTAIVDEEKIGHVLFLMFIKMKPMTKEIADTLKNRLIKQVQKRQNVRLITVLFVNGEYDWIVEFSAPDHTTARRYYDSVRQAYDKYLIDKPLVVDVNFCPVREGKINPNIDKLYDLIPIKM